MTRQEINSNNPSGNPSNRGNSAVQRCAVKAPLASDPTAWRSGRRGQTSHIKIAAAVACGGLVLMACGSSKSSSTASPATSGSSTSAKSASTGPVTITFANWASDESNTVAGIKAAIALYEKENPGVTIVSQPVSYSNIGSQLLLEVRSGDAPDIAEVQGDYTAALAYDNALQPLTQYAGQSFISSLVPQSVTEGTYNGQFLATPWVIAPFGLWYNKNLLSAAGISSPPNTITEFEADLAKIRAKYPASTGVIPFGFDTTNRSFGLDINWSFMKDFGATPMSESTNTLDVQTPQFTDYLQFMRLLGQDNYDVPNQLQGHFRSIAAVNKVAFAVDGPYFQSAVQATNHMTDAQFYAAFGVTTIPAGSNGVHYTVPTDHQLVMFKTAKNKTAAWKFMQWLTTSPQAVKDYSVTYEDALPPRTTTNPAWASLVNNPNFLAFKNQIEPTVIRPAWGPKYDIAFPPIMTGVESAVTTSTPLAQIESTMVSEYKTALQSAGLAG
jgi:ABC-type glycerol-3-phosphate transport system substrate-binding protein